MPELELVQSKIAMIQAQRGGDRRVGHKLWSILVQAGFTAMEQDAILTSSESHGLDPFLLQLDPDRLVPLVVAGLLPEEDLVRMRQSYERWLAAEHPRVIDLMFLVCGTKPASKSSTVPET